MSNAIDLYDAAVESEDVDGVRKWLALGADFVRRDEICRTETTILHDVVSKGHGPIVEKVAVLVNEGRCDVNILDSYDRTPLICACQGTNENAYHVVRQLLILGANPNLISRFGTTALCEAAEKNNCEVAALLLEYGAEVNPPIGRSGAHGVHNPPVTHACRASVKYKHHQITACRDDIAMVQLLVKHGANVNALGVHDTTPLWEATLGGRVELVRFFLEHGADPNISTPLSICIMYAPQDVARLLLERGADPNAPLAHPPMFGAIGRVDSLEIVQLLHQYGADLNLRTEDGDTLLCGAARQTDTALVEFLLEQGADPNLPTPIGTPLKVCIQYALYVPMMRNAKLLLDHGADPNVMFDAIRRPGPIGVDIVKLLLDYHPDLFAVNRAGRPLLDEVRRLRRNDLLEILESRVAAEKNLAVAMGFHSRLGSHSPLHTLDPGLLEQIIALPRGI